jgi:hypothetical protein
MNSIIKTKSLSHSASGLSGRAWRTALLVGLAAMIARPVLGQDAEPSPLELTACYEVSEDGNSGRIVVRAALQPGHHIYSLTQRGTPPPSRLDIEESNQFWLSQLFRPDRPPTIIEQDATFGGRVEKHYGVVEFVAPIGMAAGEPPERLQISLTFNGLVCRDEGSCMPLMNWPVAVPFAGRYKKAESQDN